MDQDGLRIVIADDHPLFRQGVAQTLSAEADIAVVAQGATADEAVQLVGEHRPHLALLDVTMPGGGLTAAQAIAARYPETVVAMLTVSEQEDDVTAALRAGAKGYVLKGVSGRELVGAVRGLCDGKGYVSPTLAASVLAQAAQPVEERTAGQHARPAGLLGELTEREQQILERVAAGDSNKEIARTLCLSEKTVKHYMTSVLQKLQARNRVEAALMARESGWAPAPRSETIPTEHA